MGWGGVVASALAGGVAGVGEAMYQDQVEKDKNEAQKQRDAALAQLAQQTHAVNTAETIRQTNENAPIAAQNAANAYSALTPATVERTRQEGVNATDERIREDAAKPKIVPRESRLVVDGKVVLEGDMRTLTPEEQDLINQRIETEKAKQESLRAGADLKESKANAPQKADMANFKDIKGADGVQYDSNTMITRKYVEGGPAIPGKEGIGIPFTDYKIGAKPGKPSDPGHWEFFDQDMQPMTPAQVAATYPKKGIANTGTSGGTGAAPRGASTSGDLADVPPMSPADSKAFAEAVRGYQLESAKENPDPQKIEQFKQTIRALNGGTQSAGAASTASTAAPAGWVLVGRTPDGRNVYRTPDGKQKVL